MSIKQHLLLELAHWDRLLGAVGQTQDQSDQIVAAYVAVKLQLKHL